MTINLVVAPSGQPTDAEAAAALLENALEDAGGIERTPLQELPSEQRKAIDPVSLGALVLSVPSAVLAVMDIVDRAKKRRRAAALIDASKVVNESNNVTVYLLGPHGPMRLDTLGPDQLLDLAQQESS